MTPRAAPEVVRSAERYLAAHGIASPRAEAEVLVAHVLGIDRVGLYAGADDFPAAAARSLARALCRRVTGTPLQHITGEQGFFGLSLGVGPGVFVPRPETERLVEAVLEVLDRPDPVVVDVCTGSGAVALALKRSLPKATVHATDVSLQAVAAARENAARNGLDVDVFEGDLLSPLPPEIRGEVDLVVANPPYVEPADYWALPDDVRADPAEALVGGTEVHGRLAVEAARWLRPGGWLVMEIGDHQGPEIEDLLLRAAYTTVRLLPDLTGRDRVARGRLARE